MQWLISGRVEPAQLNRNVIESLHGFECDLRDEEDGAEQCSDEEEDELLIR